MSYRLGECVICEPVSIIMAASAVIGVVGGVYKASAEKAAGNYQNEVAKQNAGLADFQAEQEAKIGAIAEERHRAKVKQMIGSQRAGLAANGLDLSGGTALDLVTETAMLGEEDALMLRFNAMNKAWGYRTEATNLRNDGKWAKAAGQNAATATYLNTASQALSSASNMSFSGSGGGFKIPSGATTKGISTTNSGAMFAGYA